MMSGEILERKAAWIASINEDLKERILNQESGKRFFSDAPELEDAFFTLSELCDAYERELKGHRAGLLERVYASIEADAKKKTEEGSAFVGLYKDWEILNSIQTDGWDGLTRFLRPLEAGIKKLMMARRCNRRSFSDGFLEAALHLMFIHFPNASHSSSVRAIFRVISKNSLWNL